MGSPTVCPMFFLISRTPEKSLVFIDELIFKNRVEKVVDLWYNQWEIRAKGDRKHE